VSVLRRLVHAVTGQHFWAIHEADTTVTGQTIGPWRYCQVCSETIPLLNEPTANHPDSMAPLPPEQEKQLAALEALLARETA
jgi:hypothetical protein